MKNTKKKLTLESIIKYNNGLNLLTNQGIGFKDAGISLDLSLFKFASLPIITAYQEVVGTLKGTPEEKLKEQEKLVKKEYKIDVPVIPLETLKNASKEIPLVVFDFLHEFIER